MIAELKDRTADLQKQATESTRTLKQKATEWQQAATDNATELAKNTDVLVRENVWIALGIAAAFAFTLGLVIGSRRD